MMRTLFFLAVALSGQAEAKKPVLPPPVAVCVRLDDGSVIWREARPSLGGARVWKEKLTPRECSWKVSLPDGMSCVSYPAPGDPKTRCDEDHAAAPVVETILCPR